ncbi:WAP four-disulfide core domain protein 2 isoform X2 [Anolis carolinensis]|uniref:WAP four-disulfide core domain protein 2 isoform X2 n=1 Tax=Anolis carolinensis TaxID=28377 RepID=UPI002F2B4101
MLWKVDLACRPGRESVDACLQHLCSRVEEKPGVCPKTAPPGHTNPCKAWCKEDAECPGKQKCCKISCGNACLMPMHGVLESLAAYPTGAKPTTKTPTTVAVPTDVPPVRSVAANLEMVAVPSDVPPAPSKAANLEKAGKIKVKPGLCPKSVPLGHPNPCRVRCEVDNECPGREKCCRLPCGKTCVLPVRGPPVKPGVCPTKAPPGVKNPCSFPCKADSECPGNQKCCKIHCGNTCMAPRHHV